MDRLVFLVDGYFLLVIIDIGYFRVVVYRVISFLGKEYDVFYLGIGMFNS